ncbi:MAG: hypothetical protein FWH21_05555 [Kiritimatiellaeota bacterium]|nr:hypothetical protein [Kiritimatiellota bacterium]
MKQTINLNVADRNFKYYIFDWDDNILRMPTHIHLERRLRDGTWVEHRVSTSAFAVVRNDTENYRPPHGDWAKAFVEFRDFGPGDESQFLTDARAAIDQVLCGNQPPPPSFNTFRKTLAEGRIFAIVTARGHSSETLRRGVELFIARVLSPDEKRAMLANLRGYTVTYEGEAADAAKTDAQTLDYYLSLNKYHAVTSPQFERLAEGKLLRPGQSEERKQFAIRDFIEHLFGIIERTGARKPISVGFSDDDPANVRAVQDYIRDELAQRFPSVRFVIYDTSDPSLPFGRKITVSGQMLLDL